MITLKPAAPLAKRPPPPPPLPQLTRNQASLVTRTAHAKADLARKLLVVRRWQTWADMTRDTSLSAPPQYTSLPFNAQNLDAFLADYIALAAPSLAIAQSKDSGVISTEAAKALATNHTVNVEAFTLRPQQRKSVDLIIAALWEQKLGNAVLNPLRTGAGKSIIAGTIAKYLQDNNWLDVPFFLPQAKFVFLTKKAVVEKIIRTFKRMGVRNVGRNLFGNDVCVTHYGALRSKANAGLFETFESILQNNPVTLIRYKGQAPLCIVLDECQEVKKWESQRTQYVWAFYHNRAGRNIKWLLTSATPGITLNDMMAFSVFSGVKYTDNEIISRENFASWVTRFRADPRKANAAAMERFRDYMGALIVSPPNDPSKVKATNKCTLLKFKTYSESERYHTAEAEYIAAIERVGRGISDRGLAMVQFMIYRAKCELMSVPYIVELALERYRAGFAPVVAFCFQESVRDYVLGLIEAGIPRSKISLIWGGDKAITESEIFKSDEAGQVVLMKCDLDDPVQQIVEGRIDNLAALVDNPTIARLIKRPPPEMPDGWDKKIAVDWVYEELLSLPIIQSRYPNITLKKLLTRYRKWTKYTYERVKRDESEIAARERREKLTGLKLTALSDDERQREIDRFLDGTTEFCCYTLSAGGTGVDLDHQQPQAKPRHVFSTICYYAEEFMQALGRCMRVATLTDVTQEIIFFEGTIAAQHVAPRLMKKVASIAKIASSTDDLVSVLEASVLKQSSATMTLVTEVVDETASEVDETNEDDDDND